MSFWSCRPRMKQKVNITSTEDLATIIGVTTEKLIEVSGNIKKYIYFKRKTTGTKKRLFIIPNKELRRIQTPINKNVLQKIKVPQEIGGGKKKRSIYKNALPHCGQKTVVTLDIKDFFPSISSKKLKDTLVNIGFNEEVSAMIVKLTTYNGRLPLGFSTSPILANIVLMQTANRFKKLAEQHNLKYSVWVDDIAISGHRASKFKNLFRKIVNQEGFEINEEKSIKIMKNSESQLVTKLSVNSRKPKVSKKYRKNLRAEIHNYKIQKENNYTNVDFKKRRQSILGKITHVQSIDKSQGNKLKKQLELAESK